MCVTNFAKCYEFYSTYFNFHPSEVRILRMKRLLAERLTNSFQLVHNDEGVNVTVFFRLDRGKEFVDHHCFFFFEGPKMHVHHSSFETHDFDAQVLGHDWLRHQGYTNCWGVGRHVMGSQIFDYWFDPSNFILEHYVDGDLLDMNEPTHHNKAAPDNLHVWGEFSGLISDYLSNANPLHLMSGPEVPPTFLQ